MASLMTTPASSADTDVHRGPPADHPRRRKLVLILKLNPLLNNHPATLARLPERRVKLLVNRPLRRTAMPVRAVLNASAPARPARLLGTSTARERRRLPLPRPTRLLKLTLQPHDPSTQPLRLHQSVRAPDNRCRQQANQPATPSIDRRYDARRHKRPVRQTLHNPCRTR